MEVVEVQVDVLLLVGLLQRGARESLHGLGCVLGAREGHDHLEFLTVGALDSGSFSDFAMLHEELDGILLEIFERIRVSLDFKEEFLVTFLILLETKSSDGLNLFALDLVNLGQNNPVDGLLILHFDVTVLEI